MKVGGEIVFNKYWQEHKIAPLWFLEAHRTGYKVQQAVRQTDRVWRRHASELLGGWGVLVPSLCLTCSCLPGGCSEVVTLGKVPS